MSERQADYKAGDEAKHRRETMKARRKMKAKLYLFCPHCEENQIVEFLKDGLDDYYFRCLKCGDDFDNATVAERLLRAEKGTILCR